MFSQILNLVSLKEFTSLFIDYTLLTVAFFAFFVLVNNIIKAIKINESQRALVKVKI
ncbi:hypothetical protein KO506_13855 [Polaribacter vadi]|uniref:hypothetical protein n=1 Tax=Polaribacter TaxID=52959 RepID=UPI001C0A2F9B|nr:MULTISPECIES: hypothetical protein [Polaribacter]MBU3012493.1 hypothetical protein [Polaribacter vadi]MDO6742310.1 hypothetical protein [Polaribacter sp. 1_MG-2023]